MPSLKIIKPGALALIQDFGRYGYTHMGVTNGGPVDEYAFSWCNKLLGNVSTCPCIELTLGQAVYEVSDHAMFAIAGGDLNATLDDKPLNNWSSFYAKKGQIIRFGLPKNGLRAYLAVKGGFKLTNSVLGSVSTVVRDQLGGLSSLGKPLQSGDEIEFEPSNSEKLLTVSFRYTPDYNLPLTLRVIESYQAEAFSALAKATLYSSEYEVTQQADRMGYRLSGSSIDNGGKSILSEGIALGSIQVPPNGQPIVLLNDRQTIGGYPKLGCVAKIDLPRLAQAKPGQKIRFVKGDLEGLQRVWCQWARYFGY
ncbi:biotin-dependent carboxyltransferase family protein [Vibrio maerlii]|uniref:5-oxoprolinase subunit C family protein n=1 Tax=Vibrio maerlii TaxID=2231648 RepID=UPI000E3E4451|nr:biotin-dependent carboxyltransferase family protein [Vibrio maerlii]